MSSITHFHLSVKYCEYKTFSASRSAQFQSHRTSLSTVTAPASLNAFATLLLCFTSVNIFANKTKDLVTRISATYILFHILRLSVFQIKSVLQRPSSSSGPRYLKDTIKSREILAQRQDVTYHMISFFHQHRYEKLKTCSCLVIGNNGLSSW